MFKDTQDGQTHSFNDGCGETAHNSPEQPKQEEWAEEFQKRFPVSITAKHPFHRTQIELIAEDREKIKDFIRSLESRTRVSAKKEAKKEVMEKLGIMRQWLNENRIKDPERFVTNEMLMVWFDELIKK